MRYLGALVSGAAAVGLMVGLSFAHPFGDPRAVPRKGQDTLMVQAHMPPEAKRVLLTKCADCHSNETRWPAYARLAPGSWLIERDITQARRKMNLSTWDQMDADTQEQMIGQIIHEAKAGEMPPLQYRLLHWDAQLTAQDVTTLSSLQSGQPSQAGSAAGDAARGKAVFEKRCTGCHSLEDNREGPPLGRVFGRKAGSVTGFQYSAALKSSGIVWNDATLERWLNDPDATVQNNKMDFHLPKSQERSDVIAYFKHQLGNQKIGE